MLTIFALAVLVLGSILIYRRLNVPIGDEPIREDPLDSIITWEEDNLRRKYDFDETQLRFLNDSDALKQVIDRTEQLFLEGQLNTESVEELESTLFEFKKWLPASGKEKNAEHMDVLQDSSLEEPSTSDEQIEPEEPETRVELLEKEAPATEFVSDILGQETHLELEKPASNRRTFVTELMLSAGPRKKFAISPMDGDTDLGEDVAGFIQKENQILFWILDGSSDGPVIRTTAGVDLFSSRHLAHTLGFNISKLTRHYLGIGELNPQDLVTRAVEQTRLDWSQQLAQLDEADRVILANKLIDAHQTCSTTVLVGLFTDSGQLVVFRIGDSFLLPFDEQFQFLETALAAKPKGRQNTRLFFRIKEEEFQLEHNSPIGETIHLQGVKLIIGATDGVGNSTMALIKQHLQNGEESIRRILIGLPQKTQDDKTLFLSSLV